MSKNYYAVLRVSDTASTDDIKRAYRALARKHHPDVIGTDTTVDFSSITQAYEVLSDPQKRAKYDKENKPSGTEFKPFMSDLFTEYTQSLPVLKVSIPVSFRDAVLGADLKVSIRVPVSSTHDPKCSECKGTGQRVDTSSGFPQVVRCDNKKGKNEEEEIVELGMRIPRGSKKGDSITIENIPQNAPYRKIIATLDVADDDRYARQGNKLTYTLELTTVDLLIGAKKRIPFFEKFVMLTIPSGTSPNEKFEVTHNAYPDLAIKVKLNVVRSELTNNQIDAIRDIVKNVR